MGALDCCAPRADEGSVLSLNSLPLGFRFRPTDEELIDFYLRQKINGNGDDVWVIREIDVCKWEPWDLPDLSVIRNKDPEWFFFCPQDRKYPNGHRLNRATSHGYWKATGKDRKIKSGWSLIGMKKTLVFYTGRAPKGKRTHWVMHEYRPTQKELDGTNPGQNAYVLCRLFKKQDETLEGSKCDEVDRTVSTPNAPNYSPEEIQSDPVVTTISSPLATEDDKHQAAPSCNSENSEDTTSNLITAGYFFSDGCDAYNEQNQVVASAAFEDDPLLNLDILCDLTTETLGDKLFSPVHVHMPANICYPLNNELDGRSGLQLQYGTNEASISDFFNSVVNWDEVSCEDSSSQKPTSTVSNAKDNGSGSDSDGEMTNIPFPQAIHTACPEEVVDSGMPFKIQTIPDFCGTISSDLGADEQNRTMGLSQNNPQMPSFSDVPVGQAYSLVNVYGQSSNYNTFTSGDHGTGIRIRNRQVQNEQPNTNPMAFQGTAPRRIRLQCTLQGHPIYPSESCTPEVHELKPIIAMEKASENHAAEEEDVSHTSAVNEPQKTSPESTDVSKTSKQHAANVGLKDFFFSQRFRFTAKVSSGRRIWSSILASSVVVLVAVAFYANIWGYLKPLRC